MRDGCGMSAATLGADLLDEVQVESLDQLLSDLRHNLQPHTTGLLGLPQLDRLLDLFRFPPRQEAEVLVQDWESPSTNDQYDLQPNRSDRAGGGESLRVEPALIELAHSASSPGKTNLLYQIAAASVIPRNYGGKEGTVVWLDTDFSFSATRLRQICVHSLKRTVTALQSRSSESIAEDSLKHVHVFPISSSRQLVSVLDNIHHYLLQSSSNTELQQDHHSMHRPLSQIILDSATAFYWTDRFDAEMARLEVTQVPGSATTRTAQVQAQAQTQTPSTATQVLNKLKSLQSKFDCVCIYTTKDQSHHSRRHIAAPAAAAATSYGENTPALSPWTLSATLSLTLTRLPTPQFASHMSLEECMRDRAKRQEVVSRNRVRVAVNEEWLALVIRDSVLKDRLAKMDGKGAFVIRINDHGVDFETGSE